jgi:hypothetical protein
MALCQVVARFIERSLLLTKSFGNLIIMVEVTSGD